MDIQSIYALIQQDMDAVDTMIQHRLQSVDVLINQLGHYIINSGGKRLRPAIALLSARACNHQATAHINLATIIEFIHTATLLHDDVVDESDLRRGKPAAKSVWGNSASILVGDFLFARAFTLMVDTGSLEILGILSNASSVIAEGEVRQLAAQGKLDLLVYMDDGFEGWDAHAAWDDMSFGLKHAGDFDKLAIVGGAEWIEWCVKACRFLFKGEVRTYRGDQLEEAWEWVAG